MSIRHFFAAAIMLLLVPVASSASNLPGPGGLNSWTIYAFANTAILQGILQSASALIASQSFRYLLEFVATLGLLGSIIGIGLFGGNAKKLAWPVITSVMFLTVGIGTTTNVTIQDTVVTGNAPAVAVVPNVPIIAVIPEAIVSTLGHQLAYLLDIYYSTPNQLTVTGGSGFNLAASLVNASTKVVIPDPLVRASLASYAQNCIVPTIASGNLSPYLLTTATAMWDPNGAAGTAVYPCGGATGTIIKDSSGKVTATPAMECVNPSLIAVMYSDQSPGGIPLDCAVPNGGFSSSGAGAGGTCTAGTTGISSTAYGVSCALDAYDYLNSVFHNGAPNWFQQSAGAWASTGAYSWVSSELTSAESYLFGGTLTQSSGETIQQSAAINALNPALNAAAMASGQSQMVTSTAVAQAETSQVTAWATAVNLFQDLSGYIYSVLQSFLVAMTPLLLAAAFLPGAGWPMVKSYMKITIWLALWMPVLSIINYIVTLYGAQEMTGVFGTGGGGYSMQSMAAISQMTEHLVLAGGFLATLTPLITWALVNGSFAFTEFLAEGLGGRLASMAGSIAATGNVSLDNQSFGNTSMNQRMMATTTIAGNQGAQVYGTDGGVQMTTMEGDSVNRTAAGIAASRGAGAMSAQGLSRSQSIVRGAQSSASRNLEAAETAASQADRTLQNTVGVDTKSGTSLSADESAQLRQDAARQIDLAQKNNVVDAVTAKKAKEAVAGVNVDPGAAISALSALLGGGRSKSAGVLSGKLGERVSTTDEISHKDSSEASAGASDKTTDSASLGRAALLSRLRSTVYSAQATAAERVSRTASEQFRQAAGFSQQASENFQEAAQVQSRIEQTRTESGSRGYTSALEAANASRRVRDATDGGPQVGAPVPGADDIRSRVEGTVPRTDALPVPKGDELVAGGVAASGQATTAVGAGRPILQNGDARLDRFDKEKGVLTARLTAEQAAADAASDKNRGAAAFKYEAGAARVDLGQDQTKATAKRNTAAIEDSTNSLNPFNLTAPPDASGGVAQAGAVAAAGVAGNVIGAKAAGAAKNAVARAAGAVPSAEGGATTAGAGAEAVAAAPASAAPVTAATESAAGAAPTGGTTGAAATGASAAEAAPVAAGAETAATAGAVTGGGTAGAATTGAVAAEAAATTGAVTEGGLATAGVGVGGLGVAATTAVVAAPAVIGALAIGSAAAYEKSPRYANALNSIYRAFGADPKKYASLGDPVLPTAEPDLRSAQQLSQIGPDRLSDEDAVKLERTRKEPEASNP